ncbi:MAG TPA: DUF1553 domain-containing protein [Candidatus Hydrogenedentes bacterium]|nr:DUF1553 domain-containing protein [Candidatus Hydrogenedentota bacterium]
MQGSTLTILKDDSVLASGTTPAKETYTIEATTKASKIRAVQLEALLDDSWNGKLGRSSNGNFVLTEFELEYADEDSPDVYKKVSFMSAKVDTDQRDYRIAKAIDGNTETGWAPNGHEVDGKRTAVFVASEPFGNGKVTKLRIKLAQNDSKNAEHLIGRFRVSVTEDPSWGVVSQNPWKISGPYVAEDKDEAGDKDFLSPDKLDLDTLYPDGRAKWSKLVPEVAEEAVREIDGGLGASYLYRNLESPVARTLKLKLGAGEALKIWLNGELVLDSDDRKKLRENEVMASLDLKEGRNDVLLKVISFGSTSRFLFDITREEVGALDYNILLLLAKPKSEWTNAEEEYAKREYRSTHWDQWDERSSVLAKIEGEKAQLEKDTPMTMVMGEMGTPRETFILNRGDYDNPTEKVTANTPAFLSRLPDDAPKNRLGLARWLVSEDNPLTSRVTVNRMWTRFFGTGLVATPEDFGSQGQWPTHPELLDWLAAEFVESGWDVKALQRLILMSSTYRQSSKVSREVYAKDPENKYLARAARFRVDAEVVRDSALAVSGLLVHRKGGKSVLPYQPPGLWQEVGYGGNFTAQIFKQDEGEGLFRRSMYTFWKRTSPPPSMMVFDAPNRETCTVQRNRSNTPLQALTLMNDPQFVEAARGLAQRILEQGGESTAERISFAFELATARPASEREIAILTDIYDSQIVRFSAEESGFDKLLEVGDSSYNQDLDKRVLATWIVVASTILNMDETITRS